MKRYDDYLVPRKELLYAAVAIQQGQNILILGQVSILFLGQGLLTGRRRCFVFVFVCVDCLFILCFKKGALLYYSIVLEPRVCGLGGGTKAGGDCVY